MVVGNTKDASMRCRTEEKIERRGSDEREKMDRCKKNRHSWKGKEKNRRERGSLEFKVDGKSRLHKYLDQKCNSNIQSPNNRFFTHGRLSNSVVCHSAELYVTCMTKSFLSRKNF